MKILVTGSTTTGKTTLLDSLHQTAFAQSAQIKHGLKPGKPYEIISEVAREVLSQHPELERSENLQDILFAEQTRRETEALSRVPFVICDRGVVDNIAHSLVFAREAGVEVQLNPSWIKWCLSYDVALVTDPYDIEFKPTPLQLSIDPNRDWASFRKELHMTILFTLRELGVPYLLVKGDVETRLEIASDLLRHQMLWQEVETNELNERRLRGKEQW